MRILVEPGDYLLRNAGDTAMLRIALTRLRALFPDAQIDVFTRVPDRFRSFAPDVTALSDAGRRDWFDQPLLNELLLTRLPRPVLESLWRLDAVIKRRWPGLAIRLVRRGLRRRGAALVDFDAFIDAVAGADLVLATGMGGLNDSFAYSAGEILDVFGLAQHFGARSAMMGQGIGPLEGRALRARARTVLRRIDVIALRERREGPRVLRQLGVVPERIAITGDDAIEIARNRPPARLGDSIGINLRRAAYAGVDSDMIRRLRPVVRAAARQLGASLIGIPISHVDGEQDVDAIRELTGDAAVGRGDISAADRLDALMDRVHRCRVVLAGSYHAAVFALASGIPAVTLANSRYYRDKFLGLADQFGAGCTVLSLAEPDLELRLAQALHAAWESAPRLHSSLLAIAADQCELGRQAYARIARVMATAGPSTTRAGGR